MRAPDHRQAGTPRVSRRRERDRHAAAVRVLRRRAQRARRPAPARAAFERGIQKALQRILASPKFCFHIEQDPSGLPPGSVYRISDRELASRLSFFLWSSIPDTPLLDLAAQNRLHTPAVLEAQVRRMLADPKADALTTNFAGQWLYLRNLKNIQPNSEEFPDFDDNLRQAFEQEASLFFASIVHEDRGVLDLMTADYTFLNERLAQHYGIPNVYGSHFRRVTLADEARRGLLGKGAVLMVTSHTDRTSPVVRGKWVLDNLLAAPVPPMAANVPPLNEDPNRGGRILTMRERMEEHRRNPACAQCHKIMDPIGLSMENFDAVGAWRMRDGDSVTGPGTPIDAQGELLDGTKINGVVTLRQALLRQPDLFVGTVTEKLMIYALGRGLQPYDMPSVRAIVRETAQTQLPFLVDRHGHRQQYAVPEARDARRVGARAGRLEVRSEGAADVYFKDEAVPSNGAPWHGRHAHPAAARSHGAGADGRADAAHALRRDLHAARPAAGLLGAEDHRQELRVQRHHEAGRGVPRPPHGRHRALRSARRSCDDGVGVAERRHPLPHHRREREVGHHDRSGRRQQDRPGFPAAVARAGHGRLHRLDWRLRHGLQLRLHEHDLVEERDDAAADGNQPAHRVRAAVRAARHRAAAPGAHARQQEHPRLGARRSARPAEEAGWQGPGAAERLSRQRPRDRTADSEGREERHDRHRRCPTRRSASPTRSTITRP